MGDLETVSSMVVHTTEGDREIQLLFGDITKLPLDQKVDVIMVSAFPGDYSATRTSVIGALKYSLGLSVRDLARDKQEDLRSNFCCWWSKQLPASIPYRRLLCFERSLRHHGSHPSRLVGEVFRAMFPAFNNKESTVITPLLAAGDQGYSAPVMLTAMVNAAANWMRHGLPLTSLKVVIYRGDKNLLKTFNDLKSKWESRKAQLAEPTIKYDVYLSFCQQDQSKVEEIENLLKTEKKDLKIFAKHQNIDESVDFQDAIYDIMITCVKVVAILSPAYLQSEECLEQFNIALCCDRKTKREMLAPFYVETIPALPTYMCMVQYIDVRIQTTPEKTMEPLFLGCKVFIEQVMSIADETGDMGKKQVAALDTHYDVFISYCHKNQEYATELFALLQRLNPELRIFFDRNELVLGNTWQKALYYAVGGARCMLALISNDYIKSLVCTEEYNLALAKHLCWENDNEPEFFLVPIAIEDVDEVPYTLSKMPVLDGRQDFPRLITKIVNAANSYITQGRMSDNVLVYPEIALSLGYVLQECRKKAFLEKLEKFETPSAKMLGDNSFYIGLSYYDVANKKHAEYLDKMLTTMAPNIHTTFSVQKEADLVTALEKCDLTVALVSQRYTVTRNTSDEFHHAIGRHRISQNGPVLYPIGMDGQLPFNPLFFHLVPCTVNCGDWIWSKLLTGMEKWTAKVKTLQSSFSSDEKQQVDKLEKNLLASEVLALQFACWDIFHLLKEKRDGADQNIVLQDILKLDLAKGKEKFPATITPDEKFYKKLFFTEDAVINEMENLVVVKSEPDVSSSSPAAEPPIVNQKNDGTTKSETPIGSLKNDSSGKNEAKSSESQLASGGHAHGDGSNTKSEKEPRRGSTNSHACGII